MDFLFHGDNLSLANGWVEGVLHLFLELVFAFPEQNLLLGLDEFNENVTLLLLELRDLVLQLDRLVLHLLQLLLELHFDVEVVVGEELLALIVLVDQIIQFVHFADLVFLGHLQLGDVLVVTFDLGIDSDFLLVEDGLLRAEIIILTINL